MRCHPRVTAAAVGHLVRAGLLVYLGGAPEFPDAHLDQAAALARRRDLPALLDRHRRMWEMKRNAKSDTVGRIRSLLDEPEWYEFGRNDGSDINAAAGRPASTQTP